MLHLIFSATSNGNILTSMNLNLAVLNFETREELWTLKGVEDFYLSSGSGHHSQYFRAG